MTGINTEKAVELSPIDQEDKILTKEEHAVNFAKVLAEIDRCIQPFRDHKRDLKEMYKNNLWLSKEEMTAVAKAFRSLKSDEDIERIADYVSLLRKNDVKVG